MNRCFLNVFAASMVNACIFACGACGLVSLAMIIAVIVVDRTVYISSGERAWGFCEVSDCDITAKYCGDTPSVCLYRTVTIFIFNDTITGTNTYTIDCTTTTNIQWTVNNPPNCSQIIQGYPNSKPFCYWRPYDVSGSLVLEPLDSSPSYSAKVALGLCCAFMALALTITCITGIAACDSNCNRFCDNYS